MTPPETPKTPKTPETPETPKTTQLPQPTKTPKAPHLPMGGLPATHRHGSIMVLVIVSLSLMAIMGALYLQATRTQRFAVVKIEGDIEAVEQSIIALITTVLTEDLENGGEMYDYDWTNSTNTTDNQWPIALFFGGADTARGGYNDDAWLASSEPEFTGNTWPHITNLMGHFLADGTSGDLSTIADPSGGGIAEHVIDFSNTTTQTDTGIPLNDLLLVDADGDGIGDSRWAWAPITQINGLMYTMAVRIVDLSGKVNVNTAMGMGRESAGPVWTYDNSVLGTDAPKWDTPSGLDFGRFTWEFPGTTGGAPLGEIRTQLGARFGVAPVADELIARTSRISFWQNTGRFYADPDYSPPAELYAIDNLHELLHANGLNMSATPTTGLEGHMGTYLRNGTVDPAFSNPTTTEIEDHFTTDDPRHHLTTLSGTAIFAPRLPSETGANPPLKIDINQSTLAAISSEVSAVFNAGPGGTLPSSFNGSTVAEFADQFAACAGDYVDSNDGIITEVNGRFGFEYLPQITEVYVQGKYDATTVDDTVDGFWDITWNLQGKIGYAIEIRNPYPFDVPMDTVELWVDGSRVGTGVLSDIATVPVTLPATGVLVLYTDSNADTSTGSNDVDALINYDGGTNTLGGPKDTGDIWNTGSASVSVELRVSTDNGSGAVMSTWAYSRCISRQLEASVFQDNALINTDPDPSGSTAYAQAWSIGNGEKLQMITVEIAAANYQGPALGVALDTAPDKLGESAKGVAGTIASPTTNQIILANAAIEHVGEIAHLVIVGPNASNTIAQAWNSATNVTNHMLNFSASAATIQSSGNLKVPHAAFLIDRFTTLDPGSDGVDNDGDGSNTNETIVQGLINLNTAPLALLQLILPIPDTATRNAVAAAIVNYRDNPGSRSGPSRTNLGLAYLGELFTDDALLASVKMYSTDTTDTPTASDGTGNIRLDFLANDSVTNVDGIADDREEEQIIARWLSQVASVRSDYFAAYILVNEWQWPGTAPVTPTNSSQFIVIFRRNAVSGSVQVVAVYDGGKIYYY